MSRIGIFGGSFNPIHNGHIHLVECAVSDFSLDRVILMPTAIAPHKSSHEYVSAEHRLKMCELAADGIDGVEVSSFEIDKGGKSYTVDTIRHFRTEYPYDELFLLVGSDMLSTFDEWYRYEEILENASLCAVSRLGNDMKLLEEYAEKLRRFGNVYISQSPSVPMSSSKIRRLVKNRKDFSCYLPEKVVQYIKVHSLYREEQVEYDV